MSSSLNARLVRGRQPLSAVLARNADPGEPRVEEHALQLSIVRDRGQLFARRSSPACVNSVRSSTGRRLARIQARARAGGSCSTSSTRRLVRSRAALMPRQPSAARRAWRGAGDGRPACRRSARFSVTRRRKRWRSCSKVTPIPPWICTQSCTSSAPYSPDERLRRAAELGGVGLRAGRDGRRRRVADRVARLEPRLHVGEAVLQLLVRRERPAERVALERPLDRHVERGLHRADRLGSSA